MDVGNFVRHLCELVLRHQMLVSNYFVNSFYSAEQLPFSALYYRHFFTFGFDKKGLGSHYLKYTKVVQKSNIYNLFRYKTLKSLRPYLAFKGTVRPDWICMRVISLESPLKRHQPLHVFNFLVLILNIL
jgi:hypothetical protein